MIANFVSTRPIFAQVTKNKEYILVKAILSHINKIKNIYKICYAIVAVVLLKWLMLITKPAFIMEANTKMACKHIFSRQVL